MTVRMTAAHVRELAALARLDLDEEEIARLSGQLEEILARVEALGAVEGGDGPRPGSAIPAAPLRADAIGSDALEVPSADLAPEWVDGLFTVPRLASHGGSEDS